MKLYSPSFLFAARLCLVVSAGVFAVGCKGDQRFGDTEGRSYVAVCEDARCSYRRVDDAASPAPSVASSPTLRTTGRLLTVCEGGGNGTACRPVTCTDGCPNDPAGRETSCVRGLCVDETAELTRDDVLLLCLAGTGTQRSAEQAGRIALAHTCGTPCKAPAACRQP